MADTSDFCITDYSNVDAILHDLEAATTTLPVAALQAARTRRAEIVPHFIERLQNITDRLRREEEVPYTAFPLFAILSLAEFRAHEGLPVILDAMSLPKEKPHWLMQDLLTELLCPVLVTLAGETPELLEGLIDDPQLDLYVRWSATEALVSLVVLGKLSREHVLATLETKLREAMDRHGDQEIISALVSELSELAPKEAMATIREAFARNLVDEVQINLEFVEESLDKPYYLEKQPAALTIDDIVKELEDWELQEPEPPLSSEDRASQLAEIARLTRLFEEEMEFQDAMDLDDAYLADASDTVRYTTTPIGRNEPCPCGSGKKFKKCCGKAGM